jgi:glutathione S-transferase
MSHAKTTILNILDNLHNFQNHMATTALASATDSEVREAHQLLRRFETILRHGYYFGGLDTVAQIPSSVCARIKRWTSALHFQNTF